MESNNCLTSLCLHPSPIPMAELLIFVLSFSNNLWRSKPSICPSIRVGVLFFFKYQQDHITLISPFFLTAPLGDLTMEIHMGQVTLIVVWSWQVAGKAWIRWENPQHARGALAGSEGSSSAEWLEPSLIFELERFGVELKLVWLNG